MLRWAAAAPLPPIDAPEGSLNLGFRDSPAVMDSRFRGNDVIRARYVTLTKTVIPTISVIPAEAGIQVFGNAGVPPTIVIPAEAGIQVFGNAGVSPTIVIPAEAGIHRLTQGVMNPRSSSLNVPA